MCALVKRRYGYNIEIGENFFANHNTVILDGAKVTFGDNVFIAPDCGFHTAGHPIDFERRSRGLEYAYPITVGSNVWIGAGVPIMPGVTIGSNVVIGCGSVVVKDIPRQFRCGRKSLQGDPGNYGGRSKDLLGSVKNVLPGQSGTALEGHFFRNGVQS